MNTPERSTPACPHCGSTATEPLALFGPQLLTAQYRCQACQTPFACVKDDTILADFTPRKEPPHEHRD